MEDALAVFEAIGAAPWISPKTVEYHLAPVYTKMGIRSRSELTRRMARETSASLTNDGTD